MRTDSGDQKDRETKVSAKQQKIHTEAARSQLLSLSSFSHSYDIRDDAGLTGSNVSDWNKFLRNFAAY
ncbi:Hypothetical predicted protein [Octopus vulgaris]|uniref:Uncharacterized protein n=1 Tax=Octopus vulgaris TaxID=6645 RepID=A0AA36BKX8_OCTVU|nr:Hypothetical predicted protein [Octopus vulgaris]